MINNILQDLRNQFNAGSALIRLIFVNIAVFVGIHLIGMIFWLFGISNGTDWLVYWLATPADLSKLIIKPWTLISYMFLHQSFFHIAMNMMVLYFGGQIFLQFLSSKRLVGVYFLGGLAGILLYILTFNVFPVFTPQLSGAIALGASASVMAILVAGAAYVPNMVVRLLFLGNVKLKYLAIGYVVLDLISIKGSNSGGHIAHLGGALFGYLFVLQLRKGKDLTAGFNSFFGSFKNWFKSKPRMKVVHNANKSDYDFNAQKKAKQDKVDAILDKISKSGYDSLSGEEKAILFDASKK